jgi:hypothetical protein
VDFRRCWTILDDSRRLWTARRVLQYCRAPVRFLSHRPEKSEFTWTAVT